MRTHAISRAPTAPRTWERSGEAASRAAFAALRGLALIAVIALAIASIMPLYWMIIGSFKIQLNAMAVPPEFWPPKPTLANWDGLLFGQSAAWRWFLNSLIVATGASVSAALTSSMAGYTFAKKSFPGRLPLFWTIILTMILPTQVTLIPLFLLIRQLHWFDTYQAMIAPWVAYPFGIFLLKQFVQTIPNELLDAARIDGANDLHVFFNVIAPLATPAIAAVVIFSFIAAWNDYIWQLVVTSQNSTYTLPIGVSKLVSSLTAYDLGTAMAGATFAFIPMLIVFLSFQRYFVQGITMGAIKG